LVPPFCCLHYSHLLEPRVECWAEFGAVKVLELK
jgi:hypothetical protein